MKFLVLREQSDRSCCLPKSRILVVLEALRMSFEFWVLKTFWVGVLLGMKLVGKFVGILIFSEQSDRSHCLPKS